MTNPIRNFECDDDTWEQFQTYCQHQKIKPAQMLLRLINSCIEKNQSSIIKPFLDTPLDESLNHTITEILNLVYECKAQIEEQNYKISQLTDNIHDLEIKSKSNETNISILLENNQQLEDDQLGVQDKTNEIIQKLNSFEEEYYHSLEDIVVYLDKIELNKLTKSQLIGLLKQKKFEYSDSFTKDKLIQLCQENGLSAIEYQAQIKLPNLPKNKNTPE
jgi:hypothetical protein